MHVLSLDLEPRTDLPLFQGPKWLPPGTPVTEVKAALEPVPESAGPFSHLILSGSTCSVLDDHPFVPPSMDLVRDAVARRVPVLGICYGHQLIVRALLGDSHVRRSETPEIGWHPIEALPRAAGIFDGLPDPFHAFNGHYDEVCDLPGDWEVIARSKGCAIGGYRNERLKILGFQFHPEMDLETGNRCYTIDRETLAEQGFDMERVFAEARDDGSGAVLIPRFLSLPW